MSLALRVRRAVHTLGEPFTVGATTGRGVFATLGRGTAAEYVPIDEVDLATRPMWIAYVASDDATTAGQTVTWLGQTYLVKRRVALRHRGAAVAAMLVLFATTAPPPPPPTPEP